MRHAIPLISIVMIFLINCNIEPDYPTGNFSIREIEIEPEPVYAGDIVTLTAIVDNPDNESLNYDWDVEGGTIIGDGYMVQWETPSLPGVYTLTLIVTGKSGVDKEERYIEVL